MVACRLYRSILASHLYYGAAAGSRIPAVMVRSPPSSWFQMWRAVLNGGSFLLFCFFLRLGRQHGRLERALDLEPSRIRFECWFLCLLGGDLGHFQGFCLENGRMIPTSQTHDGDSMK